MSFKNWEKISTGQKIEYWNSSNTCQQHCLDINDNKVLASIILFLLFFSFNIPVSIHFVILIILLAWIYKKNW